MKPEMQVVKIQSCSMLYYSPNSNRSVKSFNYDSNSDGFSLTDFDDDDEYYDR